MSDSDEESDTDDFLAQYVAFKKRKDQSVPFNIAPMAMQVAEREVGTTSEANEEESKDITINEMRGYQNLRARSEFDTTMANQHQTDNDEKSESIAEPPSDSNSQS